MVDVFETAQPHHGPGEAQAVEVVTLWSKAAHV